MNYFNIANGNPETCKSLRKLLSIIKCFLNYKIHQSQQNTKYNYCGRQRYPMKGGAGKVQNEDLKPLGVPAAEAIETYMNDPMIFKGVL